MATPSMPIPNAGCLYVVNGDQVRWVPAFDATLFALASLSVVRVFVGLLRNGRRRNRA